jgi:uncharacterized protein
MKVQIREIEKVNLKNPTIVEGFPDFGMVGTISTSYLIDQLDMKLVGFIQSPKFPPVISIHESRPIFPARIYASKKHNLLVLISEFIIPPDIILQLAEEILAYAKKKKAKLIYSLSSLPSVKPDDKIYGIASNDKTAKQLKKYNVDVVKEGAMHGVSGVLAALCTMNDFPSANLLVKTSSYIDPKSAARLLDKYAEITSVSLDTEKLIKEGAQFNKKLKTTIEKLKGMKTHYKKMEEGPSMYG